MSSPRKHPSLYPQTLTDLFLGEGTVINMYTPDRAKRLRYQLYAFREALRKHPNHDISLLAIVNATTLSIRDSSLIIAKPTGA